ncbi:MAG: hypothetical protein SVV80_14350, partial [Planctomycetota bacterium]|nr:hypothetical protein [Planctomycetota bacterium]
LPFINGEIAEIEVGGQVRLVSSIYGGDDSGRIYIFDPETGESLCRYLPEGIPGAYMLRPGPDGLLYLGCGEGSLVSYDPRADKFEILVSGEMDGLTWGGCVTDSLVVWSANPGGACVYDWRNRKLLKTFERVDSAYPPAMYAHSVIECPDGKILLGLNFPNARLVLLDPETLEVESHTPSVLQGHTTTHWLAFIDAGHLVVECGNEFFVLQYPSFEMIGHMGPPEEAAASFYQPQRASCLLDGNTYSLFGAGGDLWRVEPTADQPNWQLVHKCFAGDSPAIMYALADRYVCALDTSGQFLRYDTLTDKVFDCRVDSTGLMRTHAMCLVPEIGRIFGGPYINQRFWEIDLATGKGRDLGQAAPGAGEICAMVWDLATDRLIMANYTTCHIIAFDPAAPVSWPENPRVLTKVGHEQMRPKSMVHDGRFIWLTSGAEYGRLGGALSRIDPTTGEVRVWRNIVPNQAPNSIMIDPGASRLCFATEVFADGDSKPATEHTAQLVSFDTDSLTIDRQQAVREGTRIARLLAILPSGDILGLEGNVEFAWHLKNGVLFIWNPNDGSVEYISDIVDDFGYVATGPDGKIYASVGENICTLTLEDSHVSFKPVIRTGDWEAKHLNFYNGKLYCVVHNELWEVPLE